jgi:hypothetical protein
VTLDDALAMLGLGPGASWPAIRSAYRARIRAVHPDVVPGAPPDAAVRAARLNAAFAVLERAYRRGEHPALPPPAPAATRPRSEVEPEPMPVDDDALVLVAPAGELFHHLADALDVVGSVTYADPEGGVLAAVVADGRGQLIVTLRDRGQATEALFTLEAVGSAPVPPIDDVVRAVARLLRRSAR